MRRRLEAQPSVGLLLAVAVFLAGFSLLAAGHAQWAVVLECVARPSIGFVWAAGGTNGATCVNYRATNALRFDIEVRFRPDRRHVESVTFPGEAAYSEILGPPDLKTMKAIDQRTARDYMRQVSGFRRKWQDTCCSESLGTRSAVRSGVGFVSCAA